MVLHTLVLQMQKSLTLLLVELLKDPSFKRYAALVDRALAVFDAIVEWPDYIAFLGRLLKVLPKRKLGWLTRGNRLCKRILRVGQFLLNWSFLLD